MTTPLILPVTEIGGAVNYYGNLLGVEAHWPNSSEAVLSIPSEKTDLHLVEAPPEVLLRALDDGSLDLIIGSLWRMTGGWTVAPGKGGVCCQACAQGITATPHTPARTTSLRHLIRRISRRKAMAPPTDSATDRTWRSVGDSPLIAHSAVGVLQSASVRKIAVRHARATPHGVRISFADAGLPDVVLVGASHAPPPGSVVGTPRPERLAVTIPFYPGRRRSVLIACDLIRLA